jgi:hypothetical protein
LYVPRPRNPARSTPLSGSSDPEIVVGQVSVDETGEAPERPPAGPRPDPEEPSGSAVTAGIDIRWTEDGSCIVELRGRPTRTMLTKARDLLWSRSPQDRLTIVVSDAVLTRELFAMLIAGRRRSSASGVLEIVGLDAPGARRIADSLPRPR